MAASENNLNKDTMSKSGNSPDADGKNTSNGQTENVILTKGRMLSSDTDDQDKDTISRKTANIEQQGAPTNNPDVDDKSTNERTDSVTNTVNGENVERELTSRISGNIGNESSGARYTAETDNFSVTDLEFESGDLGDLDTDRQTEYSEIRDQDTARQINTPYYDSEGLCQYNPIPPTSTGIGSIQRMLKLCVDTKQQNSTTPMTPPPYYQLPLSGEQANMNF